MATLGLTAMQWVSVGSTAVSTASAIHTAQQNKGLAEATRRSAEAQGNLERAAAQREAIEARRQARVAQSRALAVAGRGDDKTVLDVMGGLGKMGEASALSALFEGEGRARYVEARGANAERQAKSEANQSIYSAVGQGALSFADVYGDRNVPVPVSSAETEAKERGLKGYSLKDGLR